MNKRSIAQLNGMFGISFPLCNDLASISHLRDPIKEKHQTGNQGNSDKITENSIWRVLRLLCSVMHIIAFGSFLLESAAVSDIFAMGGGEVKNHSRGLRIFPLMVAYCSINIYALLMASMFLRLARILSSGISPIAHTSISLRLSMVSAC